MGQANLDAGSASADYGKRSKVSTQPFCGVKEGAESTTSVRGAHR